MSVERAVLCPPPSFLSVLRSIWSHVLTSEWLAGSVDQTLRGDRAPVQMALSQILFHWQKVFSSSMPLRGQDVLWGRGITRGLTSSIFTAADVWRHKYGPPLFIQALIHQWSPWAWWHMLVRAFIGKYAHATSTPGLLFPDMQRPFCPKINPKNPLYTPWTRPPSVLLLIAEKAGGLLLKPQHPDWQEAHQDTTVQGD